jgi:cyclohexyl-isocyanide hydratase
VYPKSVNAHHGDYNIMNETRPSTQLQIGSLIFPEIDQIDSTGPFEVFSRIPNATCLTIAKERGPLRDGRGLILTPEKTFAGVGQLDLLHVPGGAGQEALMDDEETLSFIRRQSENAKCIFSVCTGALIPGGRRFVARQKGDHPLGRFPATELLRSHSRR